MSEPFAFDSLTPRMALPLLFAAQAQKEFFHNEALARIDALLHAAIEGEENCPPSEAVEGQCWLVGSQPSGAWKGCSGSLAIRQSGQWLFATPVDGMRIFDKGVGQFIVFSGTWQKPASIEEPSCGLYVDSEARAAIGALITALRASGILPSAGRQ